MGERVMMHGRRGDGVALTGAKGGREPRHCLGARSRAALLRRVRAWQGALKLAHDLALALVLAPVLILAALEIPEGFLC